jgi:hypothetical protein
MSSLNVTRGRPASHLDVLRAMPHVVTDPSMGLEMVSQQSQRPHSTLSFLEVGSR